MGFIGSFWQGMTINIIEGLCNGNVAIVRTTVAEIVQDKKYVFADIPFMLSDGELGPLLTVQ